MSINPELLKMARSNVKAAFVAAGDPSMGGAPMDPAMGGAPMDPAAAGGAAPMDPSMAGGGAAAGGDPMAAIQPMIDQAVQAAMAAQGGAAGGAGAAAPIKPKIDINVEVMQIKKMLAKIIDTLGIHVPAQEMVATPEDLQQMAEGGPGAAAMTPDNQGGGLGEIGQISPMKAAEWENGVAFQVPDYLEESSLAHKKAADLATAILASKG